VLVALAFGDPSLGQIGRGPTHIQTGTVTRIDSVSMNFGCHGRTEGRLYWVTRATHFRSGGAHASFFDLKTGHPVNVISHQTGNRDVADVVTL